jgi:hypothetical protein
MLPERMTGPTLTALTPRRAVWLGVGCALLLTGCGTETRVTNEPSSDGPSVPGLTERSDRGKRLPAPDAAEIRFDADTQTLKLYDLPPTERWMVQLPHDKTAKPVGREIKLPEGIEADKTMIYITEPGGKQSKAVSLTQVQRAGESFTSRVP